MCVGLFLYIYLHIQVANHVRCPMDLEPRRTALYHSLDTRPFPHMAIFLSLDNQSKAHKHHFKSRTLSDTNHIPVLFWACFVESAFSAINKGVNPHQTFLLFKSRLQFCQRSPQNERNEKECRLWFVYQPRGTSHCKGKIRLVILDFTPKTATN